MKVKRHYCAGLKSKFKIIGRQEAQIRLESERQLVKIVTIHKSKGLDMIWFGCYF